jgi:hypothetical protein
MSEISRIVLDAIPAGSRVAEIAPTPLIDVGALPMGCRYFHSTNIDAGPVSAFSPDLIVAVAGMSDPEHQARLFEFMRERQVAGVVDIPAPAAADLPALQAELGRSGLSVRAFLSVFQDAAIALLAPVPQALEPPKTVAVISYYRAGNFGDRLGFHILNSLLPSRCRVDYLHVESLPVTDLQYDLTIVGLGNSVFQQTLHDRFFRILQNSNRVLGIFGTQYRSLIEEEKLHRLLERMDAWFARYGEDVNLYGARARNVSHLGDWQISQFPMTTGKNPELLRVGKEIWEDLPLDRTIQKIQERRKVFSERLHPLLCALTSAEEVGYQEQRERKDRSTESGKFRSMLIDVFGRSYPEDQMFEVDRQAVAQYRDFVLANLPKVKATISRLLSG